MRTIILLLCLLIVTTSYAQIVGLWEVKKVLVGEETMTPVAKWFRFNKDETYASGNGWLQNSIGTWNLDNGQLISTNTYGIEDEFGAFDVQFSDKGMTWSRVEEGRFVKVFCQHIMEIPISHTDLLPGLWKPKNGSTNESLFIRWDRVYISRDTDGTKSTGYWHMNGHKPELTFLPHGTGAQEQWRVEVDTKKLTMIGLSDSNMNHTKTLVRAIRF